MEVRVLLSRVILLPVAALALSLPAEAGRLAGRLLSDGQPVAGAVVSAVPHEGPAELARREARRGEPPKAFATATSGADGAFALSVAPADKGTAFRLRVDGKGFVAAEFPGAFEAGETEELGDLALARSGPLAGKVKGPDGAPVAGARVTLAPRGREAAFTDLVAVPIEATTGADGTFRFDAAATARNELVVEAAGFATQRMEVPKGGALRSPIAVAAASRLAGTVKRRDGRPAAGALVRWEDGERRTRWVEAGPDGAFRLVDVPTRKGRVVADAGEDGWAEAAAAAPGPSTPQVSLVLAPPATLEGRTVNVETLRPVPRVKLTLRVGGTIRTERSGSDGRYRVRAIRPGELDVKADEARHVAWSRDGVKLGVGETKTLDVPLTAGATLSGRVVDEDGRPVADAKGSVGRNLGGMASFLAGLRGGRAAFRTRPDGTFTASRLAPGDNQNVAVTHPEYERSVLGGVVLPAGGTKAGLLFTLRRGLVVAGSVRDADGKPVAGAEVALAQSLTVRTNRGGARAVMNVAGGASDLPRGRTDAEGRFELRGVAPGDYTLQVRATGWASEAIDPLKVARDAALPPVDVVLVPGASITGTVRRRTGGGVEGYFVFARPQGGAGGSQPGSSPTGSDGAFVLDGLRAGTSYDLQVLGGGAGPGPTQKGVAAPADGVEIVVSGTGRIEGSAVDAKTGRALTLFDVSYEPERGGGMVFRLARRAGGRGLGGGVGDKVRVETEDGRFALEEVPAGKWSVVVEAKGYQVARAGGVVVEEATTTDGVEVKVPPGSLLRGRVTDAKTGRPVVEANVSATGAGAGAGLPPGLGLPDGTGLVTDTDGRFEVDGLAPGRVSLRVDHADYEERTEGVELKEGGSSVEVALARGGALGGTVLSAARQPVGGAEVTLQAAGEGGFARGPFGGSAQSAVTDATGRFRFEHLSAGRYSATAQLSGQASEPQAAVLTVGESKEDLVLVLSGGATLRGVVTGLPEAQRAGLAIWANGPHQYGASTRTGADGRFELTGLPVGTTSIVATAGDAFAGGTRSATKSVSIAEGQLDAEAEIAFEGTAALTGTVTRGGRPVSGAMLFAGGRRTGGNASTRTDDAGAFRLEGLENGTYSVSVQPAPGGAGRPVSKTVEVTGDTTVDFDVPTASLSGTVLAAATKQPLEGVRVAATLQGGTATDAPRRFGGASTDTNGRWFLDDVEPGTWELVFRREGYLEEKRNATASEGGSDGGSVELTRGEGLELRVRDGVYQIPLRGVTVRVKDGTGANVLSTYVALDGDGRGEVPSLKPGRYALVLDSSGYAAQRFEGVVVPAAPLAVALTPGGAVEIRVGEAWRAKGSAILRNAAGQPQPLRAYGEDGRVVLSASGVVSLPNVVPGSYTLGADGVAPKAFTVTEGGRTVVELP
jgi:protocatechuate 3,4-dioxygenase beta subunit